VYRGVFNLPEITDGAAVKLVLRSVGDLQSIYANGHPLGQNLAANPVGYEYRLGADILRPGSNFVAIYATRFSDENKKAQAFNWNGPGPAAIQLAAPAPQWKRSAFNGLAQVIVEPRGAPGTITLTATSAGLVPAVLEIRGR
jgi:hypothetical protein